MTSTCPDTDALISDLVPLSESDDETYRSHLSSLEQEIRARLANPRPSNQVWFSELGQALLKSRTPWALDLQAELLLLAVQWQYGQRRSHCARTLAQKAFELAVRADALSLQRRALSNLGIIHIYDRNLAEATVCLVQAFGIADRLGDRIGKCATLSNLATARFEAGLLDEALKLYRYVIELAANDPVLHQIKVEAHHNIALASFLLDDLASAKQHMELAIEFMLEPTSQFLVDQRVVMELTFIKILTRLGDLERARRHVDIALKYAQERGGQLAQIQTRLAVALYDAASGSADIALSCLKQIEAEVLPTEPAYRDVLEIELLCNRLAGRERYARYYSTRYLSHLSEWQRRTANQQLAVLRQVISSSRAGIDQGSGLPEEVVERVARAKLLPDGSLFQDELEGLAILSEMREDATGEHSFRVGRLAALLAVEIGYTSNEAGKLEKAARLHDIGKLAVPDVLLLKKGKLSAAEFRIMQRHTTEGCQILSEILREAENSKTHLNVDALRLAAEIALQHHEWWDGSGYPRGLSGEQIPETARITAIVDAFDELTHGRPYKRPMPVPVALERISALSGRQFDPKLSATFVRVAEALAADKLYDFASRSEGLSPFAAANRVIKRLLVSIGPRLNDRSPALKV